MRKGIFRKELVIVLILVFVGASIIPLISATFTNDAARATSIQLVINDDGCGDPTDKKVDVPAYVPDSGITPTLTINFTITGLHNSESTDFYGDDPWEDWKNISIFGDILYPVNATSLYHVGTKGDWNCYVLPTKPFGVISLKIDWPGNGSANNSIQIVNGSFVTPFVDSFPWGKDFNLTVTVQDMDGEALKYADVCLIWEEDDYEFNHTSGDNTFGNGWNGEYTFRITKEDQGEFSPKNITIAVNDASSGLSGYAKIPMTLPYPLLFINGSHCGKINTEYSFSLDAITYPEIDQFYCLWDWGDGSQSDWLGPYSSGETINASHGWNKPDTYTIRAKIKDAYGLESNWSEPFTSYITSKMILIGLVQNAMNMCEECIVLNMSFALIVKLKPIDLKMYSSVQVLILNDELQGVIGSRFIAVLVYGLFLSEESFTIYYHPK
jgi:hypothetical protein